MARLPYPAARRSDHTDDYHGHMISDPYRWLEDPDSPESRAWIEAQNALSGEYLKAVPSREGYARRLSELWNMVRVTPPWRRGETWFQWQNTGLQNQSVLHRAPGAAGPWQLLLDPNTLSTDGTVSVSNTALSLDGKLLAYALSDGGSDWQTWRVRDVNTGLDLPDTLRWSKSASAAWLPDGSGFYYEKFSEPQPGQELTASSVQPRLQFHRLGSDQTGDSLIYERPDQPEWGFYPHTSEDGTLLFLHVSHGTRSQNMLWVRPIGETGPFTELASSFEAGVYPIGNDGPLVYCLTDLNAPRRRIVVTDLRAAERGWTEVVPEGQDTLEEAWLVPGGFLTLSLHDASHRLHLISRDGLSRREVTLPSLGTVADLQVRAGDAEAYLGFTTFVSPLTVYRLDLATLVLSALSAPALDFDSGAYETRQLFATSPDGTRVPMFVVHRRGLALSGDHPTLLYGYGGFGVSLTPNFAVWRLAWLESGGVYVSANLRGGGEYGLAWHQAGMLEHKQNVFDDFIACAEHLIREGYTRPEHLAIYGGSNGGLLVGACMTQRPELFGAALPAVGVLDMLRFQKFTVGWAWTSDYGSSDDPDGFRTLLAYSPLYNLKEGVAYPPTLITTGDHDDRVVPAHSFKFAAELQHVQAGGAPVLIRIETRGGHGAGTPTTLLIEEAADRLAFLDAQIGWSGR